MIHSPQSRAGMKGYREMTPAETCSLPSTFTKPLSDLLQFPLSAYVVPILEKFLGEGLTGQTWIHCHVGPVSCGQRQDHVVQTGLPGASPHLFLPQSNLALYRLAFSIYPSTWQKRAILWIPNFVMFLIPGTLTN